MISVAKSHSLSTGLAMFSMFFGAGNIIFPLVIGQMASDKTSYAITGLLLTAIGVPFMGLLAIILFKGSYKDFFDRMGIVPGFILTTLIMLLIGPFGGMPRCIALSYSTLKTSLFPSLSLTAFSFAACIVIFLFTYKKRKILRLLGSVLTPLLLTSLFLIIISGLWTSEPLHASSFTASQSFMHGLLEGYNTMDLLASFFFSAVIFSGLCKHFDPEDNAESKKLFRVALKASVIGAALLSLIYIGFSFVAAYHAPSLGLQIQDELLGALTLKILGPRAGLVASATISLACLTTVIALAVVFSEFLQHTLLKNRISYITALSLTLVATYFVSILEFKGIVALLAPLLQVAYPALIMLTIANIAYKLYGFQPVKSLVYLVLAISWISYVLL